MEGGHESILIIDDDEPCAELAGEVLTMLGYKVSVFTDGTRALETLRREDAAIDLVITDQYMPGIMGSELAEKLLLFLLLILYQ